MNNHHEGGQAGCKANIEYFKALRLKYASLALEAMSNEKKWEARLELQKFRKCPKTLLTSN